MKRPKNFIIFLPILVIPLLILPRLLSPQFGFFDDAATLINSEGILNGTWSPTEEAAYGRFRPMYWFYYAFIYFFAGENPFWFFMGNTLLWMLTTAGLIALVHALGGNRVQAWSAAILFTLAGTTLENAYTLSKPELQQCLWMIFSILAISVHLKTASILKEVTVISLSGSMVFLACLSKETSVILFPISLGWFIFSWTKKLITKSPESLIFKAKRRYLFAAALGVVAFILIRSIYLPFGFIEKGYPSGFNFTLTHIKDNARIWLDLLSRDFLYLAPLAVLPFLWAIYKRRLPGLEWMFDTILWMLAWIIIYIPWIYTQEYYLLPFAAGAAVLGGILFSWNIDILRGLKTTRRILYGIPLVLSFVLMLLQLPSLYTKIRAQLAVDASNDEMLHYVLDNAPKNGVVLINIQDPNEYVGHFMTLVNVIGDRPDLEVEHFQFQDPATEGWSDKAITIVSPIVENQFYPSMRMGVFEMPSRAWNESLLKYMGERGERVYHIRHSFRSALIDTPRAICFLVPSLDLCKVPHSPIDDRVFAYGWDIYNFLPFLDE
jgi:hypothetical protein